MKNRVIGIILLIIVFLTGFHGSVRSKILARDSGSVVCCWRKAFVSKMES